MRAHHIRRDRLPVEARRGRVEAQAFLEDPAEQRQAVRQGGIGFALRQRRLRLTGRFLLKIRLL